MLRNVFTVCLLSTMCYSQMPIMGGPGEIEVAGLNYTYVPDLDGTEITNYGINLNLAKPMGKTIIGFGLNYDYFDFTFSESTNIIDLSTYENMHLARLNLSLIRPLKNNWTVLLSAGPTLMSNMGDGLSSEDFVVNVLGAATKRWGDFERNTILMIGLLYGTQFGEPRVFPALSLRQKLNEHWSYSLGLPFTALHYRINDQHRFSLRAMPQGIYGNNSNEVAVDGNRLLTDTKLQFNGLNARLSYRWKFTKNLAFLAEGGFVPAATLKVLDNANEEIYDLDPGSGAFFNIGLRFAMSPNPEKLKSKIENDED